MALTGTVLAAGAALGAPGDVLYVQGDDVNVRGGPASDAPVMMQLDRGHKLMEFERRGEWVNVGIERTGGKDGWIHRSLIGPDFPGGGSTAPADPKFDKFRAAVELLSSRVEERTGVTFFSKIENLGDGIVQLTATDIWRTGQQEDQESNLNTLFDVWDAAEGTGLPIMVRIVDVHGNVIMQKKRP